MIARPARKVYPEIADNYHDRDKEAGICSR